MSAPYAHLLLKFPLCDFITELGCCAGLVEATDEAMDGTDAMERLEGAAPTEPPAASRATLPGFVSAGVQQQSQQPQPGTQQATRPGTVNFLVKAGPQTCLSSCMTLTQQNGVQNPVLCRDFLLLLSMIQAFPDLQSIHVLLLQLRKESSGP